MLKMDSGLSSYGYYTRLKNFVKGAFGDNLGTLEVGGIEPPGSWMISPSPHHATPRAYSSYHEHDDYIYDEVRIDEVQAGDEIASLDENTGKLVWSKVKGLMDMGVKTTYRLTTASGRQIRTTAEHPYLTKKGWTKVAFLREGDRIAVPKSLFAGLSHDGGKRHEDDAHRQDRNDEIDSKHGSYELLFNNQILVDHKNRETAMPMMAVRGSNEPRTAGKTAEAKITTPVSPTISESFFIRMSDIRNNIYGEKVELALGSPAQSGINHNRHGERHDRDGEIKESELIHTESIYRHNNAMMPDVKRAQTAQDTFFDRIVSITPVAQEQVYDIEVAGTHNFVAGHYLDRRTRIALTEDQEEVIALQKELETGNLEMLLERNMDDMQPNYEKLRIWQEAMALTLKLYKVSSKFPKSETFGLTSQLRRAASSVPLNIAEGSGRGKKEFAHFLTMSATSINEVLTILQLALGLAYLTGEEHQLFRNHYLALMRQTYKLISNLRKQFS